MRITKLFIVAMACMVMTACSEKIVNIYISGEDTITGSTYVKLALDTKSLNTKSSADHGNLYQTNDKRKIYNYALFIFKSTGLLEAKLLGQSLDLQNPMDPDSNGNLTFDPNQNPDLECNEYHDAIRISTGTKTFFAITNAPVELIDDLFNNDDLTLEALKAKTLSLEGKLDKIVGSYNNAGDPVYFDNPVYQGGDNRGFMMTGVINDAQPNGFLIKTLEEQDIPIPVTVTVGLATAKVSVASDLRSLGDIITANIKDPDQLQGALEVME